jgi:endonuclease/exonuclease/phosphatase family metal-dependent hydrolase
VATPATTDFQLDMIAAENPDVVVLQEAYSTQLAYYVNGLNARQNTTAWHGSFNKTCKAGVEPTCTTYTSESVMILTKLATVAVTSRLIWAKDSYHVARATLRMVVALADGTQVNVFVGHLPAQSSGATARTTWVNTFKTWAASFAGPKLVGGDFNDWSDAAPIVSMKQDYNEAWAVGGVGPGLTHVKSGTLTLYSRIDYWFADKTSGMALNNVTVAGSVNDSDHLAVVATYAVPSTAPVVPEPPIVPVETQTTVFADRFDAFDATLWPTRVITGTRDATVPVAVAGGLLQIGALKESLAGTHYNGLSSAAYNVSNNGCAAVQLTQGLNPATTAYAMFSLVRDTSNLYRWYQSGDSLIAESKIAGVKKTLVDLPYSATAHQFLRIRKVTNLATGTQDVVFETAPGTDGVAGAYTERYRNTWAAAVNASGLKVEIKAGTSVAEAGPGTASWDNVLVATSCK